MERLLVLVPDRRLSPGVNYSITTLIMLLSAAIQLGLRQFTGLPSIFLLLPGIFISGFVFDRACGFVATLIGAVVGWYVISSAAPPTATALAIVFFILIGFMLAGLSAGLRSLLQRLAAAEKAKDLLLQEVLHRTKNNIMNIGSLLILQSRAAKNPETKWALEAAAGRVRVMVDVHDYLRLSGEERFVDMREFIEELVQKIADSLRGSRAIAVRVDSQSLLLREYKAVPIGIIINELVTNAFKYAFPDDRAGTIDVILRGGDPVMLEVRDNGVGCTEGAVDGLGSRLMQLMAQQVGGTLSRDNSPKGCRVVLSVPRRGGSKPGPKSGPDQKTGESTPAAALSPESFAYSHPPAGARRLAASVYGGRRIVAAMAV
jgi:two-component sensor histidine kinase